MMCDTCKTALQHPVQSWTQLKQDLMACWPGVLHQPAGIDDVKLGKVVVRSTFVTTLGTSRHTVLATVVRLTFCSQQQHRVRAGANLGRLHCCLPACSQVVMPASCFVFQPGARAPTPSSSVARGAHHTEAEMDRGSRLELPWALLLMVSCTLMGMSTSDPEACHTCQQQSAHRCQAQHNLPCIPGGVTAGTKAGPAVKAAAAQLLHQAAAQCPPNPLSEQHL